MRKRGRGFSNKDFPEYEDDYIDFKGSSDVDLVLSSEMMENLKCLKWNNRGEIEIGYDGRKGKLNGKVEGNRTGSYGQPSPNRKKARDFIGITKADLEELLISEGFR